MTPFFSVIVPTRNRPTPLNHLLQGLTLQTFSNFEVIVFDNSDPSIQLINEKNISKLADKRIKFFASPKVLAMQDSWETAIQKASGVYQGIFSEKANFKLNALNTLYEIANQHQPDILNALVAGFHHNSKARYPYKRRRGFKTHTATTIENYEPKIELERKLSFKDNLYEEGTRITRGKIYYGFYHHNLINTIKNKAGRIFHPLSPDYSSCVLGLYFAKTAINIPKPLFGYCSNVVSNGQQCSTNNQALLNFLKTSDPKLKCIDHFPIPGLNFSQHNMVAYDYKLLERLGLATATINFQNLAQTVLSDFNKIKFETKEERKAQYNLLKEFADKNNFQLELDRLTKNLKIIRSLCRKIITKIAKNTPFSLLFYKRYNNLAKFLH